jgi:hypothetical protein
MKIISSLPGDDGNMRIGAAEVPEVITPASMASMVREESKRHFDDNFVRDYAYGGFQGDEHDMRPVAQCGRASIEKLNKLVIEDQ